MDPITGQERCVIYSTVRASAAAMFTRNRFPGAAKVGLHPVLIWHSLRDNGSELLREAREWQGDQISSLPDAWRLVDPTANESV